MSRVRHVDFEVGDWGEFAAPPQDRPGYRSLVMAHQPLAYWRLGESAGATVRDETGDHDGSIGAGVSLGQGGALAWDRDTAVRFDGTADAVIEVPDDPRFNAMTGLTVLMWIRAEDFTASWQVGLIAKGLWFQLWSIYLRQYGPSSTAIAFTVNGNPHLRLGSIDDQWHFLAATWDGSVMRLYKDAQLLGSTPETGAMSSNTDPVRLGLASDVGGDPDNFLGRMDEVAIFDYALDADQITELYRTGVGQ